MLLAGEVIVNDQRIDKAGTKVSNEAELRVRQRNPHFASRAAAKLLGGLKAFSQIQIQDRVCLDAGASLTDAITQNGGDLDAATTIIREIYTNVYGLSGDELELKIVEFME